MVPVERAKRSRRSGRHLYGLVTALRGAPGDKIVPTGGRSSVRFRTIVGSNPATSDEEYLESSPVRCTRSHGGRPQARAVPVPAAEACQSFGGGSRDDPQRRRAGLISLDDVLLRACQPVGHRKRGGSANAHPPLTGTSASAAAPRLPPPVLRNVPVEPLRACARDGGKAVAVARSVPGSTVCDDATFIIGRSAEIICYGLMRAMISPGRGACLNAWYDSVTQSRDFWSRTSYVGRSVDTPGGLIVPVVRNIEKKSPENCVRPLAPAKRKRRTGAALPAETTRLYARLS